jgi:hypothetical protein
MSGPATALPPDIAELLTISCQYEKNTGLDGHGQPTYAAPITLQCWCEQSGFVAGGLEAVRRAANTTVDVEFDLYFNGSDANVQGFTVLDRFSIPVVGIEGRKPQALFLATEFGPPFDNQAPWLVKVTL